MCEHERFFLPHDAVNQEESAGVQLLDTERPLVYCCFCRKLLLPGRWPLLLSCLHSCCRECAVQKAKRVPVGNEAGGSSASASAVASAAASAESADAVRRQVAAFLATQRDSVLVRRRLSNAASVMFADMPQCDACSDAASGATTSATDNTAYERCDDCSLNMCYDCRQWHDRFNSRHEITTLGTSESDASSLSCDMRPQCMHHAAALAVHRTSAATAPDVFCASCERLRCADCLILCVTNNHELPCFNLCETEGEVPLCNACSVNQAMPATAKPRIAWCNACCKSLCDGCFRMHQFFASGHPVRVVGKQILNLGHLAENARLAFDEGLKHLERLENLDLLDISMKVRQQARDSFKQAEDALARQKSIVLKELEKVRDDAEDLAHNIDEIESQLRHGVDLTRSYCNMLLSSASDVACVLDQKAVVLSRLNSMLRLTDNANDLLDKAGTVIKDGSQRQPVDLIEKMIERLKDLQKQQQQEQQQLQLGQDEKETGDGSNIIFSGDDGKGESDSDNSGNQGGDGRQVESGGDNTGNGRDDSHKDEDGGDAPGVGSKGGVAGVSSGDGGGDDSSGEDRDGSTEDGETDGRKGIGDGVNGESDGVNSRYEEPDGSKVEGGRRNKRNGRADSHKDASGEDSKVVARGIGNKGEVKGASSCDRGGDDSSGERRDGSRDGGGGGVRKDTEKKVRAKALSRGFQGIRSRFVRELDESSVFRITDSLLEARDGDGLITYEQFQLIQCEATDDKKARKLHDIILRCGRHDEAIELVAKVLMSVDVGKADLAILILNHNKVT